MIYPIVKEPSAVLHAKADEIPVSELGKIEISKLAEDMIQTMHAAKGVGLAAPQIGISKRIIVIGQPGKEPYTIINPEILSPSIRKISSEEGCLSVPGTWGTVFRSASLKLKGLTLAGKQFKRTVEGFEAIIIQHEVDHLNGTLFVDKAATINKLGVQK